MKLLKRIKQFLSESSEERKLRKINKLSDEIARIEEEMDNTGDYEYLLSYKMYLRHKLRELNGKRDNLESRYFG